MTRVCPECGLDTPIVVDGVEVDACFGDLLGRVMNACCGHGDPRRAYVRIVRVHSNGTDGCVDICGGERVGYGAYRDRFWQQELEELDLTEDEIVAFNEDVGKELSEIIALDRVRHFRRYPRE